MNGDITRDTFDPRDGYTAVRAQQGRVMLDADHNEQVDIQLGDTRQGRRDLVGPSGAPADEPGFGVTLVGGQPQLTAGRYLVNGLRVRNATQLALSAAQPFLAGNTLPTTAGEWLAYLEVWERPLTAVEEPSIREVALGGPDTTLREQMIWQVRWLRLGNANGGSTCAAAGSALDGLAASYDGLLEPRLEASGTSGPCIVSDAAQFRGLENQLYRIEIHRGNLDAAGTTMPGTPTFKWSRDNGAVVAGVVGLTSSSPLRLEVERLGPGGAAGFERGTTIEVRNEDAVLNGTPGILARVEDVEGDALRLSLLDGATVSALQSVLGGARVIVRRWDSDSASSIAPSTWLPLENGLQVRFSAGRYRTGDFWLIPARTASLPGTSSQLDWPQIGAAFQALGSRGPARARAPLAILDLDGAGTWTFRRDCRQLFAPLTSLLTLSDAGGDGQQGPSNAWLPAPLVVVVSRGRIPAPGVTLRFLIGSGAGGLSVALPSGNPPGLAALDVTTDAAGRAEVYWRLGPGPATRVATEVWEPATAQRVDAVYLGGAGVPDGPVLGFYAQTLDHLNLHIVGGNAQHGRPGERLEIALRVRVDEGQRPVADAVVEFAVMNRLLDGTPLDQNTGGNLLGDPTRLVSGDTWAGGTAHHTVRMRTDDQGIAQVQWTLGTRLELSTQRVEARLLDGQNQRTAQTALFTAQLAIAQETEWRPLVPWLAALLGGANRHVQAAIDAIAQRLEQVALATSAFDPFLGVQWRTTAGGVLTLDATSNVLLSQFAALSFRGDLVPSGRNTGATTHHSGVRVYAELIDASGGLSSVVRLTGAFRQAGDRWEWTLSSEARGALSRLVTPNNPTLVVPVRITVVPRWLPGGLPTDSSVSHEMVFMLVVGTVPNPPYGLRIAIGGGLL